LYSRMAVSLILLALVCVILGAIQFCGRYAAHECSYITEVMGSDDRQCYTGERTGIVGITLQVEPIAYKILLNSRPLRRYVNREQMSNLAEEIAGSPGKGRTLPKDEKLAAIVREIQRYIYTPAYERRRAKDRSELQKFSD
jgi:hypothetical protein